MSESAAIVAMLRDCPEPIVHQMMLARVNLVTARPGAHVADQIRAMLQVLANAIELGAYMLPEHPAPERCALQACPMPAACHFDGCHHPAPPGASDAL